MRTGIHFQLWRVGGKRLSRENSIYSCRNNSIYVLSEPFSGGLATPAGSHIVDLGFCNWPSPSPRSQAHQLCKLRHLSCTVLCHVRWVAANLLHSVKDSPPDVTLPNVSPDKLLCLSGMLERKKPETPSLSSEGTNADVKEGLCLSSQSHWGTGEPHEFKIHFFFLT